MAIPPTAAKVGVALTPKEELDFVIGLSGLLEAGELPVSYELNLLPEAVALGLTLMTGGGRDHELVGQTIRFWATIDDAFKANVAFDTGISLPMELLFVTDATPSRTRNRTLLLQVVKQ